MDKLKRNCPWCGRDTLHRDETDEFCTADGCEYHVQGKFR